MFLLSLGMAVPLAWIAGTSSAQVYNPRGAAPTQRLVTMPVLPGTGASGIGGPNTSIHLPPGSGPGEIIVPPPPPPPPPEPEPELCPDGTPVSSIITVDQCMNGVLACVNGGALPGGLNDLYNADVRHAIMNGMMLCAPQVDNCIANARVNCQRVFNSFTDVWITFNSRVIQPSYYSFVLRRTGLTPNQAENTCLLLDRNVFGSSFAAVSATGQVTTEFQNQVIPHNQQGGQRNSPLGVSPNTDPARGHYARWDAERGECLIRVAAYNGNRLIRNDWLFGIAGDERPAEAWVPAGESFTCGKRLFEFGLYNQTRTMAVAGIGGGALVGAGIGALAANTRVRNISLNEQNCGNSDFRALLDRTLQGMNRHEDVSDFEGCRFFVRRFAPVPESVRAADEAMQAANARVFELYNPSSTTSIFAECPSEVDICRLLDLAMQGDSNSAQRLRSAAAGSADRNDIALVDALIEFSQASDAHAAASQTHSVSQERRTLEQALKKNNGMGAWRGAGIGAAVGAGVGGLATAITFFVEKNNINCRVGDGLDRVSVDRSRRIDSLRDFYVKWALQLPDTIQPTALVTDCASWRNACGTIMDIRQCEAAQINFRPHDSNQTRLVDGACTVSGSVCIENRPVALSFGACR